MRTSLVLRHTWWPLARCGFASLCVTTSALAAPPDIVIGQSVPNGIGSYRATVPLTQGARAYVGAINAQGGINGRRIKLVTLDGGADPAEHAKNVRTLVTEHKAVAIITCAGDAVCKATADAAAEMRVPLVGALSGAPALARGGNPWVFTVRPSYAPEADRLAKQVLTLGITRVAVVSDNGLKTDRVAAVRQAFEANGLKPALLEFRAADMKSVNAALSQVGKGKFQAVVVDVFPDTIDVLAQGDEASRNAWPSVIVSLASSSFQALGNLFPDRVIGYSQVVPNPDADSMPLTVELQKNAEKYAAGTAINFDGMSAYVAAKVAVQGLRRATKLDGEGVAAGLATIDAYDLGGYTVSFASGRLSGSDWLSIGMRSRNGTYLK